VFNGAIYLVDIDVLKSTGFILGLSVSAALENRHFDTVKHLLHLFEDFISESIDNIIVYQAYKSNDINIISFVEDELGFNNIGGALSGAARSGNYDLFNGLLHAIKANDEGVIDLFYLLHPAIGGGNMKIINSVLSLSKSEEDTKELYEIMLYEAAGLGNLEVVNLALDNGANPFEGIEHAAINDHIMILDLLLTKLDTIYPRLLIMNYYPTLLAVVMRICCCS